MTKTFGTNDNNDIYLGIDGNISVLSGLDAIIYACKSATLAQLAEQILAINTGMPNFQSIWVGSPNYSIFESYLRNILLSVEGVVEVVSISINIVENTLRYRATISTVFGLGEVQNG